MRLYSPVPNLIPRASGFRRGEKVQVNSIRRHCIGWKSPLTLGDVIYNQYHVFFWMDFVRTFSPRGNMALTVPFLTYITPSLKPSSQGIFPFLQWTKPWERVCFVSPSARSNYQPSFIQSSFGYHSIFFASWKSGSWKSCLILGPIYTQWEVKKLPEMQNVKERSSKRSKPGF